MKRNEATLKATMMQLDSTDSTTGIWAVAPFRAESLCITSAMEGIDAEFQGRTFVGTLAELSPTYTPSAVYTRWGDAEGSTQGETELFKLGIDTEPSELYLQHILPLLSEWVRCEGVPIETEEALAQWIKEAIRHHCAFVDFLTCARITIDEGYTPDKPLTYSSPRGWLEIFVMVHDGLDEETHKDDEVERLIRWAEQRRHLELPKMDVADELIFYGLESATLQFFGEESYPVFMETATTHRLHSLAHTAVSDFVVFAIRETIEEGNYPLDAWTTQEQQDAMLQALFIRRCLFTPIYEMLRDTGDSLVTGAIEEQRTDGEDSEASECLYRDAVKDSLNERFNEIAADDTYAQYLEQNPHTRKLQLRNMHRTFRVGEAFGLRTGTQNVIYQTVSEDARCDYLVRQFPFITSIVADYLTRDKYQTEVPHAPETPRV